MSSLIQMYLIDETAYPSKSDNSPEGIREDVLGITRRQGTPWGQLECSVTSFVQALDILDRWVQGTGFIPTFLTLNSPHKLLDGQGFIDFGYLSPSMASDLSECFDDLDEDWIDEQIDEAPDALLGDVFEWLTSGLEEAARRGWAVSVIYE